jgi:formate hydrogenlyase subunit 3/multisubunit Na+/H+ antiporter MnhD subunit
MLLVGLVCPGALLGLALLTPLVGPRRLGPLVSYGLSLIICVAGLAAALGFLLAPPVSPETLILPVGLPWIGAHFRLDPLSAVFLAMVNLGGAAASLFAIGYGRHEPEPGRVLPFYPAFLAGMSLVVLADDAFSFLLAWEFMSLSSWALVMSHHRDSENRRAAFVYLLMASFGTICLLLAFGLLAGPGGGYGFQTIRSHVGPDGLRAMVVTLAVLGAGSKAGLVPLHVWLPLAHPAAPSHVSGLMSGVMTKVAIYGFIRIVFDLLGPPDWWWSALVLALGGVTAVMGVLYALMQEDLKKLLAYSTVENVGVIFVGLGLALGFKAQGIGWAAALAMTGALFHALNHSVFKSLMFFGSGAVLNATGERSLERLGGLIRAMPKTSFLVLVGCVAISALPPLNGFVSEWLTFQAVLLSPKLTAWPLQMLAPMSGALLALAAALAAACFVRAYGVAFLGRPRSPAAERAKDVDRFSLSAMAILALICVIAGVLPGPVIDALSPVVRETVGARMAVQSSVGWLSIVPVAEARSSYNGLLVLVFIVVSAWMAAVAIHRFASRAVRRGPAWDCGFPDPRPITQYTASSFAQPIRRAFGAIVFSARETVEMPAPGDLRPARMTVRLIDPVWETIYAPVGAAIGFAADKLNALQFLTIRFYLTLVFAAVVSLLVVLALWL